MNEHIDGTEQAPEDDCPRCGDPFGELHTVVAPSNDPMDGGIILCVRAGCQCFGTWSPPWVDAEDVPVPDRFAIEAMRQHLQDEYAAEQQDGSAS